MSFSLHNVSNKVHLYLNLEWVFSLTFKTSFEIIVFFWFQYNPLLSPLCYLLGLEGQEKKHQDPLNTLAPNLVKFFEAQGSKKMKGEREPTPKIIREIISKYNNLPERFKTPCTGFVTIMQCLFAYMDNQDIQQVFLHFDVSYLPFLFNIVL